MYAVAGTRDRLGLGRAETRLGMGQYDSPFHCACDDAGAVYSLDSLHDESTISFLFLISIYFSFLVLPQPTQLRHKIPSNNL